MRLKKIFYKGTIVKVRAKRSNPVEDRTYMLVEYVGVDNFWFQLVCVTGYNSGFVYGYIRPDPSAKLLNSIGVTKEHLLRELQEERNLGPVYKTSLKILPKPKELKW